MEKGDKSDFYLLLKRESMIKEMPLLRFCKKKHLRLFFSKIRSGWLGHLMRICNKSFIIIDIDIDIDIAIISLPFIVRYSYLDKKFCFQSFLLSSCIKLLI
jgi:hypothetical protein